MLNVVDYGKVDARRVNSWAGTRLLIMAVAAIGCAAIAWLYRDLAMPMVFVQVGLVLATCMAIVSGVDKFAKGPTEKRQ